MLHASVSGNVRDSDGPTCILCDKHIEGRKFFKCRKCKKSPFCLDHLDSELKLCPGCATEHRIKRFNDLTRQEKSVRAFLRLSQFIFMVSAIFFVVKRFLYDQLPDIVKINIFYKYLFVWGGLSIACTVLCYVVLSLQKQKVRQMEDKIQDHRVYSRYMHR
jgi:hypothetical protein